MLKKMALFEDNVERRCPSTYIEYIACHVNSFDHCFREMKRKLNYQARRRKREMGHVPSDYICLLLGFTLAHSIAESKTFRCGTRIISLNLYIFCVTIWLGKHNWLFNFFYLSSVELSKCHVELWLFNNFSLYWLTLIFETFHQIVFSFFLEKIVEKNENTHKTGTQELHYFTQEKKSFNAWGQLIQRSIMHVAVSL